MSVSDLGDEPVVVLLHAFPVNRGLWLPVARLVGQAGFRVVVPDLPGFGASPVSDQEPSVEVMAQAVLSDLDSLGIDRFCLAGLSMGGYVAMAMLRQAPDRVSGVALVDTKMAADAPAARDNRYAVANRAETGDSLEFLVEAMIPNLLSSVTIARRREVVDTVSGWIRSNDPAGVAWAQRAMATRPDSQSDLAGFERPALVLAGADDTISPPSEQRQIAAVMPDAELVLVPDVGHLSAIEDPDAVAQALIRWARRATD